MRKLNRLKIIMSLAVVLTIFTSNGSKETMSTLTPGSGINLPVVTDVLVDGENCIGAHVSTRPHNRKIVYHKTNKTWFIFYGTGHWTDKLGEMGVEKDMIVWRASKDGKTFSDASSAIVGNGHSSSCDVLLVDDCIYVSNIRWGYWRQKAGIPLLIDGKQVWHQDRIDPMKPNYFVPYEIFPFEIVGQQLVAGNEAIALPGDLHVGHAGPHYGSICQDTEGYFWVAARALTKTGPEGHMSTWVSRTVSPNNIRTWEQHRVLFESAGPGTHAPQIIALDDGRVACVLFVKHEQMTMVYLYNPNYRTWSQPQIIGGGYESKRASAVFDPGSRRLHIIYTDSVGDARYRNLTRPYGLENWSPKLNASGIIIAKEASVNRGDDDLSLSVNLSENPAPLALVHRGPDLHLHLKYYNGKDWSLKDVKIGLQDPRMTCDEATAVYDFTNGLGILYWCQWKDPKTRERKDNIGHLRFCLVKDIAELFSSDE